MALKIRKQKVQTSKFVKKLSSKNREGLPAEIDVPEPPMYRPKDEGEPGEAALHDEQQVVRVEVLMLKGVRNKRHLMEMLQIQDGRAIDRYIKRVHARWEMGGTTREHARHRGEALQRLDLIESEIWSKLSNLDQKTSPQVALNYLKALMDGQKQRSELLGLTPKVIAHIGAGADADLEFSRRVADHTMVSRMAARMAQLIEERQKTIEHEDDR